MILTMAGETSPASHQSSTTSKALAELRAANEALRTGVYIALNESDENVVSYLRKKDHTNVLVAMNMSATAQQVRFDLTPNEIKSSQATTLLTSGGSQSKTESLDGIVLPPYSVYMAAVR